MATLTLKLNCPLDLAALAAILPGTDDLLLVWPDAKRPFDPEQWRTALTARPHSKSYLVELAGEIVGHAALLETEEEGVLAASYLYIRPERRGAGLGYQLMSLLETEARRQPKVHSLKLRVRTYNPRAAHIYEQCGFVPSERDGSLIIMRKRLGAGR